jgi:hypothetical protein
MKPSRTHAFISMPNAFFTPDVVHDAILRAAGFSDLLRVPNGWRRSLAVTQPVKQISALDAVPQLGRQL